MAEPKMTVELICDTVKAYLVANLNTKLAAIDTEYASDGLNITLATIPGEAYFFDYLGDEVANFSPFILYGAEPEAGARSGQLVATKLTIPVCVVLTDHGNDQHILRRLLRYQRSLKELFESGWNSVRNALQFEVTNLAPYPIRLLDREHDDRIIGIKLETHFA
jgi:hypothetical protein